MEADTSSSLTRLHITPLDPDLLKVIVPATALPSAKNISFHTLEAFPEKRYGFVDLPTLEAEKIKKKLNGAVLKGVKIRIEKARPDKMPRHDKNDAGADAESKKRSCEDRPPRLKEDSSKKRKRQREEIPGVELEEGRRVKRGWTATEATESRERKSKKDKADKNDKKDKKDRKEKKQRKKEIRSRYTDAPECLMKTVVPTAAAAAAEADDQSSPPKKRKSKSKTETVVIHEFEKTTKFPTFLKNSAAESSKTSATNEFVEGVGWISQDSKIVEAARSTRTSRKASKRVKSPSPSPPPQAADDTTSSSGSDSDDDGDTSSDDDDDGKTEAAMAPPRPKAHPQTISIPDASSPAQKVKDSSAISKTESPRPKSAGSVMSLTIKIPPSTPATPKLHPLEALYKRSKPDGGAAGGASATPAQPSFAFFDAEGDQADEEQCGGMDEEPRSSQQPPMTPYSRQDMEFRNIRSAAPTPDTAHHSRSFKFWPNPGQEDLDEEDEEEDGDDDEEEGDEDGEPAADGADGTTTSSSDFQKWFWENRGDLNRSWKKRRKLAAKEKRYRENRSRANRAV
ncbi:hypothetical protein RB593_008495 [Gaeumannomyces tritici]